VNPRYPPRTITRIPKEKTDFAGSASSNLFARGRLSVDDTMVHEMLHAWLFVTGQGINHKSEAWYAAVRRFSPAVLGHELDARRWEDPHAYPTNTFALVGILHRWSGYVLYAVSPRSRQSPGSQRSRRSAPRAVI
jgi:hypothetical protein